MTRNEKLQEIAFATIMALLACGLFLAGIRKHGERVKEANEKELAFVCDNPVCNCGERCACEDCQCGLEALKDEIEQIERRKQEKQQPAPVQARIVMHSIVPCPACDADKAGFGEWLNQGWSIEIIDDGAGLPGKLYPWYEVYDADGVEFSFVGRLNVQSFSENKRKAMQNAASTNRP